MKEEIRYRRPIEQEGFSMLYHVLTLDKDLSDRAFRLYALLLKYAQQKAKAYPGMERLSDDLGKTRQAVSMAMTELEDKGLISRQRRYGTSSITWIEDPNDIYGDDCKENFTTDVKKTLPKEEKDKKKKIIPDPLRFDLERKATKAQSAEGQWTVTPEAGGDDPFADGPVDAFCEVLAGIAPLMLPRKQRRKWGQKLRQIAGSWSSEEHAVTPDIMEKAIRAVPDSDIGWKTYTSPHAGNFEVDIGSLLLDDGKQKGKVLKLGI